MESAREADRAVLAALRADLDAERAAREADQTELAELRSRLAETRRRAGSSTASPSSTAARPASPTSSSSSAAPASRPRLRPPPPGPPRRSPAAWSRTSTPPRPRSVSGRRTGPRSRSSRPQPPSRSRRPRPRRRLAADAVGRGPRRGPTRARSRRHPAREATDRLRSRRPLPRPCHRPHQRQYPWLRGALVKLAHDDPQAAGKLIAGLLPVQAAIVQGPVDYDITIAEVGTFAVTVAGGRAYVKDLEQPRGRREAEFHLSADALTLAELIAGVPHKIGRFRGAARVSGRKRRLKPLKAIPAATLSLAEAARAGARLEPAPRLPHLPLRDPRRLVARPPLHRRPAHHERPARHVVRHRRQRPAASASRPPRRKRRGRDRDDDPRGLLPPAPGRADPARPPPDRARRPRGRRAAEVVDGPRPGRPDAERLPQRAARSRAAVARRPELRPSWATP